MHRKITTLLGPLTLFLSYFILFFFLRGKISDPRMFVESIKGLYGAYGYPLIFFGGFLEATFLIGFYVPGATVVLLGAVLSRTGVVAFPTTYLIGISGLMLGYILNYFLGRYGWYNVLSLFGLSKGIDVAKKRIKQHGVWAIIVGYFFPGSASLLSTGAGILRMPFGEFFTLSLISQAAWGLFWGILAYFAGLTVVEFVIKNFIFVLLGILAIFLIRRLLTKK